VIVCDTFGAPIPGAKIHTHERWAERKVHGSHLRARGLRLLLHRSPDQHHRANWTQNGVLSSGSSGVTSADSNGGWLISTAPVPDGSSAYEVKATLALTQSGGTCVSYMRASSGALSGPEATGSYIAIELQNPTFSGSSCTAVLAGYRRVSGVIYSDATVTVPCHNGMVIRSVFVDTLDQYSIRSTSMTSSICY
jgi:hypothetical protein